MLQKLGFDKENTYEELRRLVSRFCGRPRRCRLAFYGRCLAHGPPL